MLKWLTARGDVKRAARSLYVAIVAQSRLPVLYERWRVPDTVTGRFEMLVAHMALVLERLRHEGASQEPLAQALSEAFISDIDSAMREMGIADTRVPAKMHAAAGAFLGRLQVYAAALAPGAAPEALAAALVRNALVEVEQPKAVADEMAHYMRESLAHLAALDAAELAAGRISFPKPVTTERGGASP